MLKVLKGRLQFIDNFKLLLYLSFNKEGWKHNIIF
jgi:hypothetical protein